MRFAFLSLVLLMSTSAWAADAPKVSGLFQTWVVNDTTSTGAILNYRIRRAELKLTGNASDEVDYTVMVDPAKTPGADPKILQDMFLGVKVYDGFKLIVGQTKIQTTAEGLDPTAELWFPERSLQARTYGDVRQPGALLQYSKSDVKVGFMASNGVGTNQDDTTSAKDLTARVDYKVLNEVKVGAFTRATNSMLYTSSAYGLNTRVKPVCDLEVRADLAQAHTGAVNTTGYTLDAGYQLTPRVSPVVRYDVFQPNTAKDVTMHVYEAGVNYNLGAPNTKVELAYGITDNVSAPAAANGTYTAGSGRGSILTLAFQAAF